MLSRRVTLLAIVHTLLYAQNKTILPTQLSGLQLHGVKADPVNYKGRPAVRVTDIAPENAVDGTQIALLPDTQFQDGVIEADLAGDTKPNAAPVFRRFTGIAFRANPSGSSYECFYLRPKNGRSEDQAQRNHSAQYISHPEFGWRRLRSEFPSQYESYVDLVPGEWTHVKIEVQGKKAKLYVNGSVEPVLIVNDLKHGLSQGGIGLWVGPETVANFANLRLTPH